MDHFLNNPAVFGTLTPGILIGLVVLYILRGQLVPKSHVDDWKEAYKQEREARIKQDEVVLGMTEFLRTGNLLIRVLRDQAERDGYAAPVAQEGVGRRRDPEDRQRGEAPS